MYNLPPIIPIGFSAPLSVLHFRILPVVAIVSLPFSGLTSGVILIPFSVFVTIYAHLCQPRSLFLFAIYILIFFFHQLTNLEYCSFLPISFPKQNIEYLKSLDDIKLFSQKFRHQISISFSFSFSFFLSYLSPGKSAMLYKLFL